LNGSGSFDPEGTSLTYQWNQVGGPSISLNLADPARPTFIAPWVDRAGATLTFELTVSDGELPSGPDLVNITVKNVNNPPIALAANDQWVNEGSPVTLDGSASYDPDAESLTYSWVQLMGPSVSLSGSMTANPLFIAPFVGRAGVTLTFQLTVSDGIASATDTVDVYVENVNHAPIANAGGDQTVNEGSSVSLNGTASYDQDGDLLGFEWSQVSGNPVTLDNPNSAQPRFLAPLVSSGGATLVFRLIVNDGLDLSVADDVYVTVQNINDPPACGLATPSPNRLWPPNHKLVPVKIVGVTDPNNGTVTITVTSVTQDEPVDGLGDGDTSPDAVIQGDTVLLRAERSGNGNGRIYTVSFTANDGFGATCGGKVNVIVPHGSPDAIAVDEGENYNSLVK
jgi:hypothetical protein